MCEREYRAAMKTITFFEDVKNERMDKTRKPSKLTALRLLERPVRIGYNDLVFYCIDWKNIVNEEWMLPQRKRKLWLIRRQMMNAVNWETFWKIWNFFVQIEFGRVNFASNSYIFMRITAEGNLKTNCAPTIKERTWNEMAYLLSAYRSCY